MENSEMVLSIKEYHPMGGRFFPQFYRQVEIPITEIHSIKIELITKKFLIFIESKTIGKIITRTFVLQYMDEECLRKMDESLKGSI
ncbi:hypothetical protein [Chryseobacterium sp. PMSZPI]|uniref:hypothetical protein n=1 Tax=Chryseobacterium sp. PMSZPI TaxID=1033900 RepID=UPI00105571F0|nr:hypothetical protein [Chryseobacterium sp. PMSZPI]